MIVEIFGSKKTVWANHYNIRSLGNISSLTISVALSFIVSISVLSTLDGSVSLASAMPVLARSIISQPRQGQAQRCEINGASGNNDGNNGQRQSSSDDGASSNVQRIPSDEPPNGRRPPTDPDAASCDAGLDSSSSESSDGLRFIQWLKNNFDSWL